MTVSATSQRTVSIHDAIHPDNLEHFQNAPDFIQDQTVEGMKRQFSASQMEQFYAASGYVGPARDTRQVVDTTGAAASSAPATAGPRGSVRSSGGRARAARGYATIQSSASVSYRDASGRVRRCSGDQLHQRLDGMRESDPATFRRVMDANGYRRSRDGTYRAPAASTSSEEIRSGGGRSSGSGRASGGGRSGAWAGATASTSSGQSSGSGWVPWVAGATGFLMGGVFGGVAAFIGADALQSATSGLSSGGLGGWAGPGGGGSLNGLGGVASTFGLSTAGAEFHLRQHMQSIAREQRDQSMIGMIHSGMPIEDLIFYFMIFMSQTYEDKLREKMEEAVVAEQLEERLERRTQDAQQLAGLVSMIPVYGQFAAAGINQSASKMNEMEAAINGHTKSSTQLANEVQMLMQKWKMLCEQCSNLIKVLGDMRETPIRNLR